MTQSETLHPDHYRVGWNDLAHGCDEYQRTGRIQKK